MKQKLDNGIFYSMNNNPKNWKGMFYVNPNDPRIVVQKRLPALGWTLNFGKPISYIIITTFVLAMIASIFIFN